MTDLAKLKAHLNEVELLGLSDLCTDDVRALISRLEEAERENERLAEANNQEAIANGIREEDLKAERATLTAQRDEAVGALGRLEPTKPKNDPKDGPCCHEKGEDGFWRCTGCTCQNYGDAQSAALWADAMNRWIEWNNITQKLGAKPMTNASEITVRDAALLFRNPTHFDELLTAFEASEETDTAGKLDDALKALARHAQDVVARLKEPDAEPIND